jgi:Co/Zn/Cd efflux system component
LCSDFYALSAHVLVSEPSTAGARVIVGEVGRVLEHRFRIVHTTLQPESESCVDPNSLVCSQGPAH